MVDEAVGVAGFRGFRAIPTLIQSFLQGKRFVCKAPDNVWDYIYVEDATNALIKIAASDYCGTVNVGTGRPHLMRNVFTEITEKMNSKDLLSFEESQKDVTILVADPTVLDERIGYQCTVGFSEGIDRTIAWWRTQINNR